VGSADGEISAVIGVHQEQQTTDGSPDSYAHAHVRLQCRAGRAERIPKDEQWQSFVETLHDLIGESPAAVNLRLLVPREGTVTAVQLPIPFGHEISGFSQIRGVQLAEPDPDDKDKVLYSVILQLAGESISADIRLYAVLKIGSNILEEAFAKAFDVAKLALPSIANA
jgi:hypothetical protein